MEEEINMPNESAHCNIPTRRLRGGHLLGMGRESMAMSFAPIKSLENQWQVD